MATHPPTGTTPIPPGLRLSHDLNDALTTWSTSQRTVIGLAADFATTGHTVIEELQLRCAPCHQRRHDREAAA